MTCGKSSSQRAHRFHQVDGQGTVRAEAPQSSAPPASTVATTALQQITSDLTATYCAMNASQRSMAIWKRISPGMMPDTAQTPNTTSQDAFAWHPELVDKVSRPGCVLHLVPPG
jgi:hypothetical protein